MASMTGSLPFCRPLTTHQGWNTLSVQCRCRGGATPPVGPERCSLARAGGRPGSCAAGVSCSAWRSIAGTGAAAGLGFACFALTAVCSSSLLAALPAGGPAHQMLQVPADTGHAPRQVLRNATAACASVRPSPKADADWKNDAMVFVLASC
jgi:hypothetical protein